MGVGSWPQVGKASFLLTCAGAPANSFGILVVGAGGMTTPLPMFGVAVWIDPGLPFVSVVLPSNSVGGSYITVPIPANTALAGLQAFSQFFWPDSCAPAGLAATNALAITLQP